MQSGQRHCTAHACAPSSGIGQSFLQNMHNISIVTSNVYESFVVPLPWLLFLLCVQNSPFARTHGSKWPNRRHRMCIFCLNEILISFRNNREKRICFDCHCCCCCSIDFHWNREPIRFLDDVTRKCAKWWFACMEIAFSFQMFNHSTTRTLTPSGTHILMAINYKKSKVNMQKSLVRSIEINMILGFIDAFNADQKSDTPDGLITIESLSYGQHCVENR